jgi:hypothetical protein
LQATFNVGRQIGYPIKIVVKLGQIIGYREPFGVFEHVRSVRIAAANGFNITSIGAWPSLGNTPVLLLTSSITPVFSLARTSAKQRELMKALALPNGTANSNG